jgi:hypothetical protein
MKKTAFLSVLATVTLGCLLALGWDQPGEVANQPEPVGNGAPSTPFAGRALIVSLKSDDEWGAFLQNPEVKRIGDKSFLVGKGIDDPTETGESWQAGRTVWIAVDDVSTIVEFDSAEQLKAEVTKAYQD